MSKPKILVIVGPTASGKTKLAITLAHEFSGEVISADSRQVYRRLNIGTEKITKTEMAGVPHHLIDVADPETSYSATDWKRDASNAIQTIIKRNHLPIIAGGTFFYLDVLLGRVSTPEVPPNPALRAELESLHTEELVEKLQTIDPERAAIIDQKNPRRLIRAIEIATAIGSVPPPKNIECPYEVLIIGIKTDKDELRARIRARAAAACERGLVAETTSLMHPQWDYQQNQRFPAVTKERLSEIGLEYREVLWYLDTHQTNQNLIDRLETVNWQYAKRQLTWLKRDTTIEWFHLDEIEAITTRVREFLS